ncbi:putative Choline Carnitine o acyltransferase [Trypanosoma vivax]|uniref:Putative carnitine O-palmitoyltransferase II n=1 Tax=Trypanosoma vivax (strain Y486) TaxID=1055687 RepID=G0TY27_TRYVY|nr:putative carnitine O-palmitoyltransferase II [Trypanosoma vivax]KAH8618821.1 putative Choline Carnitine o acyltransferase [Trypanosoma vivax]CCC48872.1 putative carnitine O-palmitoyltransferase II [Trypanosoma vivax Y486]
MQRLFGTRLAPATSGVAGDMWHFQFLAPDSSSGAHLGTLALGPSTVSTQHFQRSLFRLPVPGLNSTCTRFLDAVKPIVTPRQFESAVLCVTEFQAGHGRTLQDELTRTNRVNRHTSYVSADMSEHRLSDRAPLPIQRNACFVTRYDRDKPDMLSRAAFWITSSITFYHMYLNNTLRPDILYADPGHHFSRTEWFLQTLAMIPKCMATKAAVFGSNFHALPLNMSYYDYLMSTTRVPGVLKDSISAVRFAPHVAVLYRGQQYIVTVAGDDCLPLPEEQIYARLRAITELNAAYPAVDVSVLTSLERTSWFAARTDLLRHHENQRNLELLDTALFTISLEDDVELDYLKTGNVTEASRIMFVRDTNRWWDKSFSVIVTRDGSLGVCFEQSWNDGGVSSVVRRYTQDVLHHSLMRNSGSMRRDAVATEGIRQLRWHLTQELELTAARAKARIIAEIRRLDLCTSAFPSGVCNSAMLRRRGASADALVQVGIQLAWWRLDKSTVSTCESVSTAMFRGGRTDYARLATSEAQHFAMLMDQPNVTDNEKLHLLLSALKRNEILLQSASRGLGIDCHLFALKKVAERRNPHHIPPLFSNAAFLALMSNFLSTFSCTSEALIGGVFGPSSKGYGICYSTHPECPLFNVTRLKEGGPMHSARDFAEAVQLAVDDVCSLLGMGLEGV